MLCSTALLVRRGAAICSDEALSIAKRFRMWRMVCCTGPTANSSGMSGMKILGFAPAWCHLLSLDSGDRRLVKTATTLMTAAGTTKIKTDENSSSHAEANSFLGAMYTNAAIRAENSVRIHVHHGSSLGRDNLLRLRQRCQPQFGLSCHLFKPLYLVVISSCTAPGCLDNRLRYAACLKLSSCQVARIWAGLRYPFFSISHSAL